MWLPDYALFLNHFGGRLLISEKTSFLKLPKISLEQFFLLSSRHLRSRSRITTCFLNLLIVKAYEFNPNEILRLMNDEKRQFDAKMVGALSEKILQKLNNDPLLYKEKIAQWTMINDSLTKRILEKKGTPPPIESMLLGLPLPKKRDPDFLKWGYAYPGIVYDPKKYLRLQP